MLVVNQLPEPSLVCSDCSGDRKQRSKALPPLRPAWASRHEQNHVLCLMSRLSRGRVQAGPEPLWLYSVSHQWGQSVVQGPGPRVQGPGSLSQIQSHFTWSSVSLHASVFLSASWVLGGMVSCRLQTPHFSPSTSTLFVCVITFLEESLKWTSPPLTSTLLPVLLFDLVSAVALEVTVTFLKGSGCWSRDNLRSPCLISPQVYCTFISLQKYMWYFFKTSIWFWCDISLRFQTW